MRLRNSASNPRCVAVLGMHRSGTSALAGALKVAGVNFGARLLEAHVDNPKGYFEDRRVVELNEAMLEALGRRWDSPGPLVHDWRERVETSVPFKDRVECIGELCQASSLFGLKDPRLAHLWPAWSDCLTEVGATPFIVLSLRPAQEVAASLAKRNGTPYEVAVTLWLEHVLAAERATRGTERALIPYARLVTDPVQTISEIFARLGRPFDSAVAAPLRDFVTGELSHHRDAQTPASSPSTTAANRVYEVLNLGELGAREFDELDRLASEFRPAPAVLDWELDRMRRSLGEAAGSRRALARVEYHNRELLAHADALTRELQKADALARQIVSERDAAMLRAKKNYETQHESWRAEAMRRQALEDELQSLRSTLLVTRAKLRALDDAPEVRLARATRRFLRRGRS